MDHFGIGTAIKGVVRVLSIASRRTGRTTSLVESVKDGDRVVFVNQSQANQFARLVQARGVNCETVVCDPSDPIKLFNRGSVGGDGRLIFDHVWVEKFYEIAIDCAAEQIDKLQVECGGHGVKHRETSAQAEMRARYNQWL